LPTTEPLNKVVRRFWEQEPCGTYQEIVGKLPKESREWFERIEQYRYSMEPFIFSVARFQEHAGKKILEVGVGAGSDHLQWAKAGAQCHGVDLTDAAIETTRKHLAINGFSSNLQRIDAEQLPFSEATFDVVYSWGVIHHSDQPEAILKEIHRVLKPGGTFLGMMYGRRSLLALRLWAKHALLKGRPFRSFKDVIWHHMESLGTKAYTVSEMKTMFKAFSTTSFQKIVTPYEVAGFPGILKSLTPRCLGWYIAWKATK